MSNVKVLGNNAAAAQIIPQNNITVEEEPDEGESDI